MKQYYECGRIMPSPDSPTRTVRSRFHPDRTITISPHWYLGRLAEPSGSPVEFNFRSCTPYPGKLVRVAILYDGEPTDFSFASDEVPIVARKFSKLIETVARDQIQRIPAEIENHGAEYDIVNALNQVDCVDETKSRFTKWTEGDKRPDKIGDYKMVKLVIDASRTRDLEIFRPKGWRISLIVSGSIKAAWEENGGTGLAFRKATE